MPFERVTKLVLFCLGLISASGAMADPDRTSGEKPVEIMILGTFHFSNPGQDIVNMKVDDVLTPRRQADIEAIVKALASWKPDRIAVENSSARDDLSLPEFDEFRAEDLAQNRSETVQIGFRLAAMLDHQKVYGFDADGDFPFEQVSSWAAANGQQGRLNALTAKVAADVAERETLQSTHSLADLLMRENDEARSRLQHDELYYGVLGMGDAHEQPGAVLNAQWYLRNARMFGNLLRIAQPGERVLVIVGSGHARWLGHFARNVPGFAAVPVYPLLRVAAASQGHALH